MGALTKQQEDVAEGEALGCLDDHRKIREGARIPPEFHVSRKHAEVNAAPSQVMRHCGSQPVD